VKINAASGTDLRPPPWVNLDIVKRWPSNSRDCDVLWDARTGVLPFPDNSADEIYAGYLLLHVSRVHHEPLMREMFRCLEPGGKITIDEVNMRAAMQRWLDNPRDESANEICWGEQGGHHGAEFIEYDTHRSGHTLATLMALMQNAGFQRVSRIQIHAPEVWYALTMTAVKP
jgi:ubiquinone/menaquinone biosynthesis C-methylase UbiE